MLRAIPRLAILILAAASLLALVAVNNGVEAGGPPVKAAVFEGDPVPGTNGATFAPCPGTDVATYDEPMVNAAGNVLFWSCLSDGSWGLFFTVYNGPTTAVALGGQEVPGVGKLFSAAADFDLTDGPGLNNRDTAIFAIQDHITGPGAPPAALFMKKRNQDVVAIARAGDSSPCGSPFHSFDDMSLNNKDDVAFIASYDDGAIRKTGVFLRLADGTLEKILCNGDSLPGTGTPNQTFAGVDVGGEVGVDGPWVNDSQTVAFQADDVTGPTFDQDGDTLSIWDGSVFVKQHGGALDPLVLRGDAVPASAGGGTIDGIAIGRPGITKDSGVGFLLERTPATGPETMFVASKKQGGSIVICAAAGDSAPGGKFEEFGAVSTNLAGDMQFSAEIDTDPNNEDPNDAEADNKRGVFTCNDGTLSTKILETDNTKPRNSTWSHELEEGSIGGPFIVISDEVNYTAASTQRGIFIAGAQENPIQGNFLCPDGHVDDLDILQLLKFEAGVPGNTTTGVSTCPGLGQIEQITGLKWGDVNCSGNVTVDDVLFMLADRAGVPFTPATVNCFQIGEVITQ